MENQYNYYNPEGQQGNAQYNSQPDHDSHSRKPKKKMPKAVVVTGCAHIIWSCFQRNIFNI